MKRVAIVSNQDAEILRRLEKQILEELAYVVFLSMRVHPALPPESPVLDILVGTDTVLDAPNVVKVQVASLVHTCFQAWQKEFGSEYLRDRFVFDITVRPGKLGRRAEAVAFTQHGHAPSLRVHPDSETGVRGAQGCE